MTEAADDVQPDAAGTFDFAVDPCVVVVEEAHARSGPGEEPCERRRVSPDVRVPRAGGVPSLCDTAHKRSLCVKSDTDDLSELAHRHWARGDHERPRQHVRADRRYHMAQAPRPEHCPTRKMASALAAWPRWWCWHRCQARWSQTPIKPGGRWFEGRGGTPQSFSSKCAEMPTKSR